MDHCRSDACLATLRGSTRTPPQCACACGPCHGEAPGKRPVVGKVRYDLVPPVPLGLVAGVLTHGTKHDAPGALEPGYLQVKDWRPLYQAATLRHFEAYRSGEWSDVGSKLPHLAHVAANALILLALELRARKDST